MSEKTKIKITIAKTIKIVTRLNDNIKIVVNQKNKIYISDSYNVYTPEKGNRLKMIFTSPKPINYIFVNSQNNIIVITDYIIYIINDYECIYTHIEKMIKFSLCTLDKFDQLIVYYNNKIIILDSLFTCINNFEVGNFIYTSITTNTFGDILLSYDKYITKYSIKGESLSIKEYVYINSIILNTYNYIFILSSNKIIIYDNEDNYIKSFKKINKCIYSIAFDQKNNIYLIGDSEMDILKYKLSDDVISKIDNFAYDL